MKYIKLLMLIVAVSFFASCSDDDDYNTQKEVTVGFEKETIVFSEGAGLQEIPVVVNGNHRNGDIRFRVEVAPVDGAEQAIEDSMFYITGYEFNIPADSLVNKVNVELVLINDRIPTDARQFRLNIVDLKGAQPGTVSATVRLEDNDGEEYTYESLFGQYNFEFNFTTNSKTPVLAVANMGGASNQEDSRYNKELLLSSVASLPNLGPVKLAMPMSYTYDIEAAKGQIGFLMNRKVATIEGNGITFQCVFLNTEAGKETEPIVADFTMTKAELKDANGNPILDGNGNAIKYNIPNPIKFPHNSKAMLYQVAGEPSQQGNFGFFEYRSLTYID